MSDIKMTFKKRGAAWMVWFGVAVTLFSLTACSRHETPKAPEKKPRVISVAPTPAAALAMTNVEVRVLGSKATALPPILPPDSDQALRERQRALRERQRAEMKKVVGRELTKAQGIYEQAQQALAKKEVELRGKDQAVHVAYAAVSQVRSEYEQACKKSIPGYEALGQKASEMEARMDAALARRRQGATVDAKELAALHRDINQSLAKLNQMRLAANASEPQVGQTLLKVRDAQTAYEQSLSKNDEYLKQKKASEEALAKINDLTSMSDGKQE